MKKQDKELLLKDISARLPYKVKVNYADRIYDVFGCSGNNLIIVLPFLSNLEAHPIEACKPYLRPMSSMTKEESDRACKIGQTKEFTRIANWAYWTSINEEFFDWLNAHHFDYRSLIKKGLALEVPEGMYNF